MAYFEYFPSLYYTLDNNRSGQIIQDIFRRVTLSDEVKNQNVLYETYQIQDGDTPEILADRFYDDPGLCWLILITNEILDPRFDWPMEWYRLEKYIERKYPSNIYLNSNVAYGYNIGETVSTNSASARVVYASGNRLGVINVSGTFANGANLTGAVSGYYSNLVSSGNVFDDAPEEIHHFEYTGNSVYIDNLTYVNGDQTSMEAVSKRLYEIRQNDVRREIKILRAEFVPTVVAEFRRVVTL